MGKEYWLLPYIMGEKFNLIWQRFSAHGQELFKNLLESQEFADVTLISDDQHHYKVHKFILCACSTVFSKILTGNPHNSSIFLRGIQHKELEAVLQFIYLGEATFYHEKINEFMNVAKSLDIKEINENVVKDEYLEESEGLTGNQIDDQGDALRSDENQSKEFKTSKIQSQEIKLDSCITMIHGENKSYKCQQCDYQSGRKNNVKQHVQYKHNGIKHPCTECNYQATKASSLKQHIKSKHEGIKYECQLCAYWATSPSNLHQHINSIHKSIEYPCQECEYQATSISNLQRHIKIQHE